MVDTKTDAAKKTRHCTRLPALLWLWIAATTAASLTAVTMVAVVNLYNRVSFLNHSGRIRALIPWRFSRTAALLPAADLLAAQYIHAPTVLDQAVWVMLGAVAAEFYAVCLHRESYIAAFEPWWLKPDARPLGGTPSRRPDRRLQYLVRVQTIYVIPLTAAGVATTSESAPAEWVIFFLFVAKYVATAWLDYEAYFHWDMHVGILTMRNAPRLTTWWREVCEWLLGPAVGSLPHVYSIEHLVLHHPANAGPLDVHSPLPFNRTSVIEFGHYLVKTTVVLITTWGITQHRRCRSRQRAVLCLSVLSWTVVTTLCITESRALGYWLLAAAIFRGANTATAQYVWHGLQDATGSGRPLSTTTLWLPATPTEPITKNNLADNGPIYRPEDEEGPIPTPGTDWAFFDNHHLLHHLHPRAHYTEYPQLLPTVLQRAQQVGAPVIALSAYPTFFSDLMARELHRPALAAQFSADTPHPEQIFAQRLRPHPAVRSRIAIVTDTRAGTALDKILSETWSRLRDLRPAQHRHRQAHGHDLHATDTAAPPTP